MDLEHPMIREIQRIGYPSVEYLEHERTIERGDVDEQEDEEKSTLRQQDA